MNFKKRLNQLLISRPVVLIGAGQLGLMALKMWPQNLQRPVMFLDSVRTGTIEGIPIQPLANHIFSNRYVYILSFFKERPDSINRLFQQTSQELVTVYDIFETFSSDDFGNGWYATAFDYFQLKRIQSLFFDAKSREIIEATAQWKFRRKLLESLEISDEANKYNLDFVNPEGCVYDFVIDGGCHDLSLLKKSQRNSISFKNYLAVEPDPNSPINSAENLVGELPEEIRIIRKGLVGRRLGYTLRWSGLLSARLVSRPYPMESRVELIRLSDLVKAHGMNLRHRILIKLHIEGLEFEVIEEFLPTIAEWKHVHFMINLSHNRESLIQIPRLLSKRGYTLKLESHSLFGEGITLYAKM